MPSEIIALVEQYAAQRSQGINLIASENYLSPLVDQALASELAGRYHSSWYGGTRIAQQIIERTEELARKAFRVEHALVSPLSGNLCDLAVLFAFTNAGDSVAMLPFTVGGYPFGVEKFQRKRVFLPVDEGMYAIDLARARAVYNQHALPLTLLARSMILFPLPVREVAEMIQHCDTPGRFIYDGSHVLGLIACGQFQAPLDEGAEVLIGSTHKTLYGPQGGLILTNSEEHAEKLRAYLDFDIATGIALVDNPHMNRIAALGVALEELLEDPGYGKRVIENAQALATALDERGVPVRFKARGFTQSHQILLDLAPDRAEAFCHDLERIGVFIDIGGRLGTAEMTHRGMGKGDMAGIAEVIAEVYHNGASDDLRHRVRTLAGFRE